MPQVVLHCQVAISENLYHHEPSGHDNTVVSPHDSVAVLRANGSRHTQSRLSRGQHQTHQVTVNCCLAMADLCVHQARRKKSAGRRLGCPPPSHRLEAHFSCRIDISPASCACGRLNSRSSSRASPQTRKYSLEYRGLTRSTLLLYDSNARY